GLESDARPTQLASTPNDSPIVRALVEKERLARRDRPHVDLVRIEIIRKGLLDIEDHRVNARLFDEEPVEHLRDVLRIAHGAVEIGGEPKHVLLEREASNANETVVIPLEVIPPQLHFDRAKAILANPFAKKHGVAVVGLIP